MSTFLRPYTIITHTIVFFASILSVRATYSIVATDVRTRRVGGAGASCLPYRDIYEALYVSAPNRSILHTQGLVLSRDSPIVTTAMDMMMTSNPSVSVDDILDTMKAMDADTINNYTVANLRQYGIADFTTSGGYTGRNLTHLYDMLFGYETENYDVGGSINTTDGRSMIYHAQANVVSNGTVNMLRKGFVAETSKSHDLAERLMAAMRSVASGGAGDKRCLGTNGEFGTSATGAFLHVDNADGSEYIHLNIIGDGKTEPIDDLQMAYEAWLINPSSAFSSKIVISSTSWISSVLMTGVLLIVVFD